MDRPTCSWANLRALQRLVAKEEMVLDVNVRERHVNGIRTLQLETLGAGAIECFDKVMAEYPFRLPFKPPFYCR